MILTLASRSGGEVRITEAQRSDPVLTGQAGCKAGIAACNARIGERLALCKFCGCSVRHIVRVIR